MKLQLYLQLKLQLKLLEFFYVFPVNILFVRIFMKLYNIFTCCMVTAGHNFVENDYLIESYSLCLPTRRRVLTCNVISKFLIHIILNASKPRRQILKFNYVEIRSLRRMWVKPSMTMWKMWRTVKNKRLM